MTQIKLHSLQTKSSSVQHIPT